MIKLGDQFGRWTVVGRTLKGSIPICECACGKHSMVTSTNLTTGRSRGCRRCKDGTRRHNDIDGLLARICMRHNVELADLTTPGRGMRRIVHMRQFAMWAVRQRTSASLHEIGRAFGRDHSTVLHGIRQAEKRISKHPMWAERAEEFAQDASRNTEARAA